MILKLTLDWPEPNTPLFVNSDFIISFEPISSKTMLKIQETKISEVVVNQNADKIWEWISE